MCKSDLEAPKFEKLAEVLSGLSAQANLEEAIQALVQLKSKKKGGEQFLRTGSRRGSATCQHAAAPASPFWGCLRSPRP